MSQHAERDPGPEILVAVDPVDYVDTFIACSVDCPAVEATVPPRIESVAARTWRMIHENPYRFTAGDVIFKLALFGIETPGYATLASGRNLFEGGATVTVVRAMRRSRA